MVFTQRVALVVFFLATASWPFLASALAPPSPSVASHYGRTTMCTTTKDSTQIFQVTAVNNDQDDNVEVFTTTTATSSNNDKEQTTDTKNLNGMSMMLVSMADENGNPLQQFWHRFLSAGGGTTNGGGADIGERGELYFFAQAVPIMGIALGGYLPVVSDALRWLTGPGLLLVGLAVMIVTALDMGDSLTPWPKPNGEGLVTTGLYSQVRHPMYAGLLSFLSGFAIWTGSVDRLLLVALLAVILEVKSDYEEGELAQAYPEYPKYKREVPSKFVPRFLWNLRKNQNAV